MNLFEEKENFTDDYLEVIENRKKARFSFKFGDECLIDGVINKQMGKEELPEWYTHRIVDLFDSEGFLSPSEIGMGVSGSGKNISYNNQWVHSVDNLDLKIILHLCDDKIKFYVKTIKWIHQHTPISEWILAKNISIKTSIRNLEKNIISILVNDRFFVNCGECSEWVYEGHAFGDRLCQSCAEENHRVVF